MSRELSIGDPVVVMYDGYRCYGEYRGPEPGLSDWLLVHLTHETNAHGSITRVYDYPTDAVCGCAEEFVAHVDDPLPPTPGELLACFVPRA